jgi:hypothetical protein
MKPDAVEFTALARAGEPEEAIESIAARNPDAAMRQRTAIGATLAGPHPRVDGPTARLNTGAPCR